MLNCHPEVFIAYEWKLDRSRITPHGKKFLDKSPEARYLFRDSGNVAELYAQLGEFLRERGHSYRVIGDKYPRLKSSFVRDSTNFKVICLVRDIRTWICKDQVVRAYYTERDLVPAAIDYTTQFLETFLLSNILHLRMEDVVNRNSKVIRRVEPFLGLELLPHLDRWWEKIRNLNETDEMYFDKWWASEAHRSSAVEPTSVDTEATLSDHPFWDSLLPIFDKYYIEIERDFCEVEIHRDIARLKTFLRFSPLSLEEAYRHFESISLGDLYREDRDDGIDQDAERKNLMRRTARGIVKSIGRKLLQILE